MATMVAYPRQGILLNPSPSTYPSALPSEVSPISPLQSIAFGSKRNSLQLSTAPGPSHEMPRTAAAVVSQPSSTSSTPFGSPRTAARKIRFAPLPDPRRSVYVTDNGEELPLYSLDSSDGSNDSVNEPAWIPAPADGRLSPKSTSPADDGATPLASQSPWSTPATTPAASPYPATAALAPATGYVDFVPAPAPSSPFLSKTKKLFKPLFPSKLPEIMQNVSTEDVLTLGTINLFRTSSRDSNTTPRASGSRASSRERAQSDDEVLGAPLGRSTSAGSGHGKKSAKKGVPFRRTQSYDTEAGAPQGRPGSSSGSSMYGQRMLNGRVYGAKRNQQRNPFANIPDREPEFVEWGYGGMGSVKAAKESGAGSMLWAPLQQNAPAAVGSSQDDEDDGSGMAWIRRRREERERKAREEAEAASAPSTAPSTTPSSPATAAPPLPESTSQVSTPKAEDPHPVHHTGASSEYNHTTLCLRPDEAEASSPSSGSPADSVEDVSETDGSEEDDTAAADEARVTAKGASVEFISKRKRT